MKREYSKRLMPGVHYGRNLNGWLMLIKLGRYGLNVGSGFTGRISLRSWEWARYDYADHFSFSYAPDSNLARWMAAYPGSWSTIDAMTKEEAKRLKVNTREFLKLMKQGNYGDARLVIGLLEMATYTLDAAWMNGYKARNGAKA